MRLHRTILLAVALLLILGLAAPKVMMVLSPSPPNGLTCSEVVARHGLPYKAVPIGETHCIWTMPKPWWGGPQWVLVFEDGRLVESYYTP